MILSQLSLLLLLARLSAAWPAPADPATGPTAANPSPLGPLIPVVTNAPSAENMPPGLPASTVTAMVVVSGSAFADSPSQQTVTLITMSAISSPIVESLAPVSTAPSSPAQAAGSKLPTSSGNGETSATGIILGSTLGGVGALFAVFCLFIYFCHPRKADSFIATRYSGLSFSDRKPIMYKDESDITRSTSKASENSNRTFWRDSVSGTFIEPLDFELGPIDGSGRLSKLSFNSIFKPQDTHPSGSNLQDWPLVSDPVRQEQPVSQTNWTKALFPMPPPAKLKNGPPLYEQQAAAASQTSLSLPENLGKLNKWLRENRRREYI